MAKFNVDTFIRDNVYGGSYEDAARNFEQVTGESAEQGVDDAYSPFDAVAGGLAGLMTAPVKSLARFAGETAIDPIMEAVMTQMQGAMPEDSKLAMFLGKRGMRKLGIKSGQDLIEAAAKDFKGEGKANRGQFSALHDKQERFEIDDSKASLVDPRKRSVADLGDAMEHPQLFEAYPELLEYDFKYADLDDSLGSFSPTAKRIELNKDFLDDQEQGINTMLHEGQHAIQHIEDFAKGGNPEMFLDDALASKPVKVMDEHLAIGMQKKKDLVKEYAGIPIPTKEQTAKYRKNMDKLDALIKDGQKLKLQIVQKFTYKKYSDLAGEIEARDVASKNEWRQKFSTDTPHKQPFRSGEGKRSLSDYIIR